MIILLKIVAVIELCPVMVVVVAVCSPSQLTAYLKFAFKPKLSDSYLCYKLQEYNSYADDKSAGYS